VPDSEPVPDSPPHSQPRPSSSPGPALPVPVTVAGQAALAAVLADPGGSLVGLDFDGTLAPIVPEPADARPLPAATAVLRRLSGVIGTLTIITGRPAQNAVDFGGLADVPGVIVLGHYGRQRWSAGTLTAPPPPPGLADARRQLPDVLARARALPGTWIEDKGDALAVHTRRTGDPGRALDDLRRPLARLAGQTGLVVEPGRMVIELRPPGADKGEALTALVAERGARAVLYCGDDLGDRPAFAAVRELRTRGIPGLAVCSGSAEVTELAQEADLVVDGPRGVVALLEAMADALIPAG
jgi:trehalose 6-phosphate phosphatase